ncbi:MAG: hypothetical protein GY937_09215, partial [bacterium]|nr:hypothetical protein [bacterium]
MTTSSTIFGFVLAAMLLSGCGDLFLSKEQRKVNDAVRQAVTANPSQINAPNVDGDPPLHIALTHRLPNLFDWLLDRGAAPDVRNESGETTAHVAVIFDSANHRALRKLLELGADVQAKRNDGGTPLHSAAFFSKTSCAELLLAAGADPNARDQLGKTPLHIASAPQLTASAENIESTIRLLIAEGADVSGNSVDADTPLHLAALIGSVLATRTLLEEGAKVDMPGLGGRTALHVAAAFAKPMIAEVLLQAGAAPNHRDDRG